MARVALRNLTKRYAGGTLAVDRLSLEIADGEFMCFVGPSGCGKTTALRMIAGLEEITGGRVEIGNRVVNHLPPRDRDIAMVFQSYALYPHMSVYENMSFGLQLRKFPRADIDRAVRGAARILDLEPYLDRKPGQLSGGQRQRVALGRAIVREPAVFLMDEPLSNLDAKLRVQTRAEIARLHQRLGATMIYVTHDQIEAMTMADRIAVLNLGVLEQAGTPRVLYERPANRFVAGFIGSPAMNFVDMTVTDADGAPGLASPDGTISATLNDVQAAAVRRLGSGTVVLGVRPEHLELGAAGDGGLSVAAVVDVTEFLGNDMLIHATSAGQDIVAVISASEPLKVGDRISLGAAPGHVYLFDPESGASLGVA
ncbi:MAG TPA: sn-glycerol-3-phosphate ABC transporter ATP-binding protein UgpC [Thermomicrobiaceae bacterium]|nr:sn-glycerol-3-phosphate ABC transporter ATP-binding protein UgpC [Thermomicrobiaceae bacterium]